MAAMISRSAIVEFARFLCVGGVAAAARAEVRRPRRAGSSTSWPATKSTPALSSSSPRKRQSNHP